MNVVMIERFSFERSCGIPGVCSQVEPGSLSSRGSIRRLASTPLLCRYRIGQQLCHPQEAVTADGQHRHEACAAIAAHSHLAHRASVLAPAKGFLDALADALAGQVAP